MIFSDEQRAWIYAKIKHWIEAEVRAGRLFLCPDGYIRAQRDVSILNPAVFNN